MIHKTLSKKLNIEQHESRKCKKFLLHLWHSSCYSCC